MGAGGFPIHLGAKNWTQTFFSQSFRAPRISPGKYPGISHQKDWFPWVSRDTLSFLAPTRSHGRKYPDQKVWVWVPFSSLSVSSSQAELLWGPERKMWPPYLYGSRLVEKSGTSACSVGAMSPGITPTALVMTTANLQSIRRAHISTHGHTSHANPTTTSCYENDSVRLVYTTFCTLTHKNITKLTPQTVSVRHNFGSAILPPILPNLIPKNFL